MALTPQQAKFAENIAVKRMTQFDAYSDAYDVSAMSRSTAMKRSGEMAKHPEVEAQIQVLREGATKTAIKAAAYTLDAAISECDEVLQLAKEKGQTSAAVAAVKLKSQLAGHVLERKETSVKDPLADATNAELVKLRAEIDARLAASKQAAEVTEGAPAVPIEVLMHQRGAKAERRALN